MFESEQELAHAKRLKKTILERWDSYQPKMPDYAFVDAMVGWQAVHNQKGDDLYYGHEIGYKFKLVRFAKEMANPKPTNNGKALVKIDFSKELPIWLYYKDCTGFLLTHQHLYIFAEVKERDEETEGVLDEILDNMADTHSTVTVRSKVFDLADVFNINLGVGFINGDISVNGEELGRVRLPDWSADYIRSVLNAIILAPDENYDVSDQAVPAEAASEAPPADSPVEVQESPTETQETSNETQESPKKLHWLWKAVNWFSLIVLTLPLIGSAVDGYQSNFWSALALGIGIAAINTYFLFFRKSS